MATLSDVTNKAAPQDNTDAATHTESIEPAPATAPPANDGATQEHNDHPTPTPTPATMTMTTATATTATTADVAPTPPAPTTTTADVTPTPAHPHAIATATTGENVGPANDESVNAPDFAGEVQTTNDLPTVQTITAIEDYTVLDQDGKSHPFKSLYTGRNVPRRVLVIFVRHFFCGNCQEYLRHLSASVTPESLLQLPVSTFIAVIGCGSYELINTYIKETGCPFPVYADPTCRLYSELGMVRTLAMGPRPAYLQGKSLAHTVFSGVVQGLKQVKSGLVTKMGDQRQVGGEFLFEPASLSLDAPIATPRDEQNGPTIQDDEDEEIEEKRITWCHRMKTTRDHAEVPEVMEVLGLNGDGKPIKDEKRWEKALRARKGTGFSMAKRMSRMSLETANPNLSSSSNGMKA